MHCYGPMPGYELLSELTDTCLATVDDAFIMYLFQLIEELSDDANDPYHYPVIRVLVSMAISKWGMAHSQIS